MPTSLIGLAALALILLALFWRSFQPNYVQFANDGPLGQQMTAWSQLPGTLTGAWDDLNSIGSNGGACPPCLNALLRWILGPLGFSKFLVPIALFTLGFGAWMFFKKLGLMPLAVLLGALAALLNSTFFSAACWGVGTQELGIGMDFLALALVVSIKPTTTRLDRWARIALAGFAVGLNIMEAADIGALFSLLVAAFVVYYALVTDEGAVIKRAVWGIGRVAVIAGCAALISSYALSSLIGTQIKGISGGQQDPQTRQQHWDWATQWSMPKSETLGLVIPGLFGYRMDSPDGANYWGGVGRDPAWDRYFSQGAKGQPPQGIMRFSGGGNYSGVLVVLLALWAALQSFRPKHSCFTPLQRKLIWFWAAVVPVSLLLAYGRFAPFYRLVYALPYFSTIRNPAKFLNIFSFALVVLFAYGVDGISRLYLVPAVNGLRLRERLKSWWARPAPFDRGWIVGCALALGLSVLGWFVYSNHRESLERYLDTVQLGGPIAPLVAAFSIKQVAWFILILAASVILVTLIVSGAFAARRARWLGAILLGIILVGDLARANLPWIVYWDYKEKYATNPVLDFLRSKPYEHRVAELPFQSPPELSLFDHLYRIEWAQHHFPYYNIQSLDVIQMPRVPADLAAYENFLGFRGTADSVHLLARRWALTNTRYFLGPAGYLPVLNEQVDPVLHRFRLVMPFNVAAKPNVEQPTRMEELTVEPNPKGPYGLIEFTGALPRVKLYNHWQYAADDTAAVSELRRSALSADDRSSLQQLGTNDFLTLKKLASPSFDPTQTVLLATPVPAPAATAASAAPGTVDITSYESKQIKLEAKSDAPAILLLNDKYDPNWIVRVDGKPADLLRCNFIMRGVYLPSGSHTVEFLFKPPRGSLYVSLAGVFLCVLSLGYVIVGRGPRPAVPAPHVTKKGEPAVLAKAAKSPAR